MNAENATDIADDIDILTASLTDARTDELLHRTDETAELGPLRFGVCRTRLWLDAGVAHDSSMSLGQHMHADSAFVVAVERFDETAAETALARLDELVLDALVDMMQRLAVAIASATTHRALHSASHPRDQSFGSPFVVKNEPFPVRRVLRIHAYFRMSRRAIFA